MSARPVQRNTIETTVLDFRRSPLVQGAEIVEVRMAGGAFRPHSHDCYSVTISDIGCGRLMLDGTMHELPAGAVCVISPDQVHAHSARGTGAWRFRTVYFPSEPAALNRRHRGRLVLAEPVVHRPSISRRLDLGINGDDLELSAVLNRLLVRVHEPRVQSPDTRARRVREILDAVRRRPEEPWTPELMAQPAATSVSTLNRFMNRHYGTSPMRYLRLQRVHAVRRHLREGYGLSILADRYRFADVAHLVRCFGAVFGVSPGRYQRRLQHLTGRRGEG